MRHKSLGHALLHSRRGTTQGALINVGVRADELERTTSRSGHSSGSGPIRAACPARPRPGENGQPGCPSDRHEELAQVKESPSRPLSDRVIRIPRTGRGETKNNVSLSPCWIMTSASVGLLHGHRRLDLVAWRWMERAKVARSAIQEAGLTGEALGSRPAHQLFILITNLRQRLASRARARSRSTTAIISVPIAPRWRSH